MEGISSFFAFNPSILFFIFIASPTASHALVEAAYETGTRPGNKSRAGTLELETEKREENDLEL